MITLGLVHIKYTACTLHVALLVHIKYTVCTLHVALLVYIKYTVCTLLVSDDANTPNCDCWQGTYYYSTYFSRLCFLKFLLEFDSSRFCWVLCSLGFFSILTILSSSLVLTGIASAVVSATDNQSIWLKHVFTTAKLIHNYQILSSIPYSYLVFSHVIKIKLIIKIQIKTQINIYFTSYSHADTEFIQNKLCLTSI